MDQVTADSRFFQLFDGPKYNLASLLLTLVLVVVSGYVGKFISDKYRELVFEESPSRTVLAQREGSSRIGITHDDRPVEGSVIAMKVFFWNAGDMPILASDELSEIRIVAPGDAQILEARLLGASRQETRIQLESSPQSVRLTWKILEHLDGGTIQVIYTGAEKARFTLRGSIVDQRRLEFVELGIPAKFAWRLASLLFVIALLLCRLSWGGAKAAYKRFRLRTSRGRVFGVCFGLAATGMGWFALRTFYVAWLAWNWPSNPFIS